MQNESLTSPRDMPQLLLESQLCFPLYAAARKVISRYTPYLKPLGITYTQYIVFLTLWEYGDMTVGDLCRRLFLDNGTLTPLLKKMEEAGYLKRSRSAADERVVTVQLTAKGWDMREKVQDVPARIGSCISMKKEEAEQLYMALYRILNQDGQA